jgi:DNA repair protein RecN (Recombination protein N)
MLRFLSIRNLAVIEALDVDFQPGLNVLTGETGAGKSILVGAVGLLVGGRASADLVRTGEETATIQGIFETASGDELILRREITAQGRSRASLNGELTTTAALRDIGSQLVDLHGQHEHQALLDPQTHLDVLDAYGRFGAARQAVQTAFLAMRSLGDESGRARVEEQGRASKSELLAFQLGEIRRAAPQLAEDDELAAVRRVLANAEKVRGLCDEAYAALYDSDQAVLATLGIVWKKITELNTLDDRFAPYLLERNPIKSHLEDLAELLRTYSAGIDASPARLQQVEDRLALLDRLKRKYGPTLSEVFERQTEVQQELDAIESVGERRADLEARLAAATAAFHEAATALSRNRRAAALTLSSELEKQLGDLAMDRTRVELRFNADPLPRSAWTARGIDELEFFVAPNVGEDLRPLARIVSGGELSRIMLALKTVATTDAPGKTLVFDEVDSGIGGRVAVAVGQKLQTLSRGFQVLCITHLPQIAVHGGSHFRIVKTVKGDRTLTLVEPLDTKGRVDEVARMIGGAEISETAKANAKELLALHQVNSESEHASKGRKRKGESETGRS